MKLFSSGKSPQTARVISYDLIFLYFVLSFIILGLTVLFQDKLRNFFRTASSFQDASVIYIFEYDEQALLSPNPTYFVLLGRRLGNMMRETFMLGEPGHGTTCPVKTLMTASGQVRYVEYQFVRYIVKQ